MRFLGSCRRCIASYPLLSLQRCCAAAPPPALLCVLPMRHQVCFIIISTCPRQSPYFLLFLEEEGYVQSACSGGMGLTCPLWLPSMLFLMQEINPWLKPVYYVSFSQTSEILFGKSFICLRSFKQSSGLLLAFYPSPYIVLLCRLFHLGFILHVSLLLSTFCSFPSFSSVHPVFKIHPGASFTSLLITVPLRCAWELLGGLSGGKDKWIWILTASIEEYLIEFPRKDD